MLTLQDRLALALTSWGSLDALGQAMGVSARTVGRWLREGEEGGVKRIPEAAATAIRVVFEVHRDVTAEQARADRIPYNYYRPVYLTRRALRDGSPGERVVGEHTQYIRSGLRMQVIADQQRSEKYLSVSVRSKIDLSRYFRLDAEGNVKQRYEFGRTPAERANNNLKSFIAKEKREKGRIIDKTEPFPLYTRYENISPQRARDDMRGVVGVEQQLRQKHEPATGQPGTVAADQILLQLIPARYVEIIKRKKPAKKRVRAKKRAKSQARR